jgi:hypothetical protein
MKASTRVSVALGSLVLVISLAACSSQGATGSAGPAGRVGAAGHSGARGPVGAAGENGAAGSAGVAGAKGSAGVNGISGATGATGAKGAQGANGFTGAIGAPGAAGIVGVTGATGPAGPAGATGPVGPAGAEGSGEAAEFYALMPFDNAATVAPGSNVQFPQNGPSTTSGISMVGPGLVDLAAVGVYQVAFQVPVTESGQLVLTLNGVTLPYTMVGRAAGSSQITLTALVQTATADSILSVQNPMGSGWSLTITPNAGGTSPVAATLLVELVKAS